MHGIIIDGGIGGMALTAAQERVGISYEVLKDVDRDKGRFRSFLLASLKHFLANEWKKASRQTRGGLVRTISFDAPVPSPE